MKKSTGAAKAQSRNRSPAFLDWSGSPIAGTPPPLPCPFCGVTEVWISVEKYNDGEPCAIAVCGHCGMSCGHSGLDPEEGRITAADCVLDAARFWNTRTLELPGVPEGLAASEAEGDSDKRPPPRHGETYMAYQARVARLELEALRTAPKPEPNSWESYRRELLHATIARGQSGCTSVGAARQRPTLRLVVDNTREDAR